MWSDPAEVETRLLNWEIRMELGINEQLIFFLSTNMLTITY